MNFTVLRFAESLAPHLGGGFKAERGTSDRDALIKHSDGRQLRVSSIGWSEPEKFIISAMHTPGSTTVSVGRPIAHVARQVMRTVMPGLADAVEALRVHERAADVASRRRSKAVESVASILEDEASVRPGRIDWAAQEGIATGYIVLNEDGTGGTVTLQSLSLMKIKMIACILAVPETLD